jgi:hypothetical protein
LHQEVRGKKCVGFSSHAAFQAEPVQTRQPRRRKSGNLCFIQGLHLGLYVEIMPTKPSKLPKIKKKSPGSSRRPKLPGRIRELASKDVVAAMLLARRGREFSEIERMLSFYYETLEKFERIQSGKKTREQELMEDHWPKDMVAGYPGMIQKLFREAQFRLYCIFLTALNERDSGKIFEIGKAIEFLKTFKESGDRYRAFILTEKHLLDQTGEKWPIRRLAQMIGWPMKKSANGFFTLRRMAKELNFPLEDSTHKSGR